MNKHIRAVIIDDNDAVTSSVNKYFSSNALIEVVRSFNKGKNALEFLIDNPNSYDLIVLDIILPEIDGIKILEELNVRGIKKKVIVLSSFKDDYTIRKIQTLGANYFMLKPVEMHVLENRILDILNQKDELVLAKSGEVELQVSTLLHDLGIPSHIRGYKYIREGILILYSTDEVVTFVTKEIYPQIANKYETTTSRVERAIRHAIEISWARGDIRLMEEIFGNSVDFDRSRPTNAEFISTIADRFKIGNKVVTM